MKLTAAAVREQGVDFTVVLVTPSALQQPASAKNSLAASLRPIFPRTAIVLCAQNNQGAVSYWGRSDIVQFCSNIFFEQLPWAEYTSRAA